MPPPSPAVRSHDEVRREALGEIRRILDEELEVASSVEPGQALVDDLHLDSMELISLAVGLEDRFQVKLSEEDAAGVATVGDLAGLVASRALEAAREGRKP